MSFVPFLKQNLCLLYSDETVGICNVTGLWPQYDEEVERACLSIEGRSFRVEHDPHWSSESPHGMYKNVFCAICNMVSFSLLLLLSN